MTTFAEVIRPISEPCEHTAEVNVLSTLPCLLLFVSTKVLSSHTQIKYFLINYIDSHVLYLWPNSLIMTEYSSCEQTCLRGLTTFLDRVRSIRTITFSMLSSLNICLFTILLLHVSTQKDIIATSSSKSSCSHVTLIL